VHSPRCASLLVALPLLLACTPPSSPAGATAEHLRVLSADLDAAPALALAPGEAAELTVTADGHLGERLATPAGNERFALILASTRFAVGAPASPYTLGFALAPRTGPSRSLDACSVPADRFSKAPLPIDPPPNGPAPPAHATRRIEVPTHDGTTAIEARALSVGEHAVIWADTTNPTTLDQAFVAQFRDDFEHVILPRARQIFGTEPDLDQDGRIQLVFTRLTHERGVAFFSACDLFEKSPACPASNHGEYLYLTPPDAIAPPYNTPNAIKEILAHEVAHLLHFQRKVLRNHLASWEDGLYLSEGIGALAQDVIGFQAGNLYVTQAALGSIDQFSFSDMLLGGQPDHSREGALRGGSYLFIRYLYDRAGGDAASGIEIENRGGPALLRALLDAPAWVSEVLPAVSGATASDLALDFYTALALSNREDSPETGAVAAANPCFRFLPTALDPITKKQRGANVFARFHGAQMQGPHLLEARPTPTNGSPAELNAELKAELRAGGVAYLAFDATVGAPELPITLQLDPNATPRVRIARLR